MLKKVFATAIISGLLSYGALSAHCQMPCGIYHDDMVYSLIDQYVETMYKGISVLNNSKFDNTQQRNAFIRWVMEKEKSSDQTANLITEYFLQQKIKSGEDDTTKRLISAHKLLFMLMQIKQNADLEIVKQFSEEWEKFKLMFHREGYSCEMEKVRMKKYEEMREAAAKAEKIDAENHHHDHDHDHEHGDHDHKH
jgi:nickel superoxide dismutase